MKYYRVAQILNTHGLKGDLKIKVITDFDRFYKGAKLYLKYRDSYIEVLINRVKDYKNGLLISFDKMDDINLVEKYKGSELFISEEDQEELSDGFYFHELVGKKLINQNGVLRGIVSEIEEVPQGYNLVFLEEGKKKRIPFIMDVFIKEVNESEIHFEEIEGLL